jgi:hypothetical protein
MEVSARVHGRETIEREAVEALFSLAPWLAAFHAASATT